MVPAQIRALALSESLGIDEQDLPTSRPQLAASAEEQTPTYREPVVYTGPDVIIRQIDEHTWEGNGHLVYNESIYLIEGTESAILIDAGTVIPGLRKIVEDIVHKPVTLIATHVHPDHTGSAINEWESLWLCAADEVNVPSCMSDYKGEHKYLTDGQIFDLGDRQIEVIFTPGHTPGSACFVDKKAGYGFSGDAFGSTNLLVFTTLTTEADSCRKMLYFMEKYGIDYLYPGHYSGDNLETRQRLKDIEEIALGIRDGKLQYDSASGNSGGMAYSYSIPGFRINFAESGIR